MSPRIRWYTTFVALALLTSPLARQSWAQGVPPPTSATAAPRGTYAFTIAESCVEHTGEASGFQDVNGQITLSDDGFTYSGATSGTMQFSNNGTLTITNAQSTSIISDRVAANAAPIHLGRALPLSCTGTHTTDTSGTIDVTATCQFSIPDGSTLTATPYTFHGMAGTSANTLILTTNNGTIETLITARADGSQSNAQRLCTRSLNGHLLSTLDPPSSRLPE